jgi:ribosomal protein S18 acetylase RimI-like enzyme
MALNIDNHSLELARVSDAARLARMSHALIESGLRPAWTESRIGWHIRSPDSVVLTARVGSIALGIRTVAGFAIMRYGDEIAHLNLLAVDPAHRRKRIGSQLVRWLEETAITAGTFDIGLELRASNSNALSFYTRMGYRETTRIPGYYQGVEPAIRMSRDLRVTPAAA